MYVLCARSDALLPLRIALQALASLLLSKQLLWLCWPFKYLFVAVGWTCVWEIIYVF
jgi:hypothetical protein